MSSHEALLRALAEARALGFLGPGAVDEHLVSADAFREAIVEARAEPPALDLGSGGGVPGLPLAVAFPDWSWVLLEANRRRAHFLERTVVGLELADRVTVVRERAEEFAHAPQGRARFGCVTARSFGPPAATAECASGLLRVGGHLLVAEPPSEASVDSRSPRWPVDGLARAGFGTPSRHEGPRGIAVLTLVHSPAEELPRPHREQRRRPLF